MYIYLWHGKTVVNSTRSFISISVLTILWNVYQNFQPYLNLKKIHNMDHKGISNNSYYQEDSVMFFPRLVRKSNDGNRRTYIIISRLWGLDVWGRMRLGENFQIGLWAFHRLHARRTIKLFTGSMRASGRIEYLWFWPELPSIISFGHTCIPLQCPVIKHHGSMTAWIVKT